MKVAVFENDEDGDGVVALAAVVVEIPELAGELVGDDMTGRKS